MITPFVTAYWKIRSGFGLYIWFDMADSVVFGTVGMLRISCSSSTDAFSNKI